MNHYDIILCFKVRRKPIFRSSTFVINRACDKKVLVFTGLTAGIIARFHNILSCTIPHKLEEWPTKIRLLLGVAGKIEKGCCRKSGGSGIR